MNLLVGKWPAVVASIDREARIVRVRIPGVTDGAAEMPEAQISYPIGDSSEKTEIRILPGDRVWVEFECGDPRYPIITGYRPKNQENGIDWRRFEHANFEFNADAKFIIHAGDNATITAGANALIKSPEVTVDALMTTITGGLTVKGAFAFEAGMTGKGGGVMTEGDLEVNGVAVGGHDHEEHDGPRTKRANQ